MKRSFLLVVFPPSGKVYASLRGGGGGGLRQNPEAQLASKSSGRALLTDSEIDYYKYDDDFEDNVDDGFKKWLKENEGNQTLYIVTSKVQAWESIAESNVRAWKSTANSTSREFYNTPPSQLTANQWELVFHLLLGLFAVCSLCLLCCVHFCCIQDVDHEADMLPRLQRHLSKKQTNTGDDDVTLDTNMDLWTDYENCQRTESLVEYVSVLRERGPGLESWNEEPLSRQRTDKEKSSDGVEKTAEKDRILSTGDWDEDSTKKMRKKGDALLEARGKRLESWNEEPLSWQRSDKERSSEGVQKTAEKKRILSTGDWDEDSTKKMRKKGDALLEARGKHNFVGYYL
ncbi:hypothetical protein ACHAW5_000891 [Stephanodiscus triporus]|uniref:Uncharacterized protein n=1 Tax=Stephanodiscus triporus TaxID=2934178 RepID=A0ABD3NQY6_9STRA